MLVAGVTQRRAGWTPHLTQPVLQLQLPAFRLTADKLPALVKLLQQRLQTMGAVPRPHLEQGSARLVQGLHGANM